MCVDFLLHHGHHVKGITHGVEAKDARKHLEASPRKDHVTFTTQCVQIMCFLLRCLKVFLPSTKN